ncbi:MAG: outer membrane protein assembly factor BamA [Gammaproteobacteria bacterium]|nr:outer membrane protein assembly factor BamA [Gammaproteobacteria bacterium]MDH5729777.1 outer membrane protein assembly factor BamA [Gammaproteobacteria bacterium]
MMRILLFILLLGFACASLAAEFTPFVIKDIELKGLKRIAPATVLNYLAIKEGETLTPERASDAIRALFRTGFFNEVNLLANGDVLVVSLVERPSISKIKIEGNEEIDTEDLTDNLKKVGFAEGRVFNRSMLEKVEQELERQYFALGKYGVKINTTIDEQTRNRVAISIEVEEGEVARIRRMNIIGNQAFTDERLLKTFQSGTFQDWQLFANSSQYYKQKLYADIENMRSFYHDRGYINFNIESTQVSITPDKREVFVTVNVTEGGKFKIKQLVLSGDLIVPEQQLRELLKISNDDIYSRKLITESSTAISERLGEEGYAFANVNAIPDVDEQNQEVSLTFFVDPGKRVYVRRVNFEGNIKTHDEVLRRELRQLEGGWYSTLKLNRSKVRLQRTGFFEDVSIETSPVAGRTDMIDVSFKVTERPSGSISASMGYGQGTGFIVTASINQNNFLGTGQKVTAEIDNSQVNRVYSFSFSDPYYTINGVSRSMRLYSRKTNAAAATSIAGYTSDVYGTNLSYGIPLSEYRSARFGVGYENTHFRLSGTAPNEYRTFKSNYGDRFNTLKLSSSWSYDTRNRILFAQEGSHITLSGDLALPGADLSFYKFDYRHQVFWPLVGDWVMHLDANYALGRAYGETTRLPFYENYYAGGGQSVRGFRDNSLGPVDNLGRSLGGNRRFTGTAEVIFPIPFSEDQGSTRVSAFVDFGNVYGQSQALDWRELRSSYGISFVWITPVGALRFSWAWPLHTLPQDRTERFQFSIGAPF